MSTGHSRTPEYQAVAQHGADLLPHLIEDLSKGESWVWRTQLVCELARTALGQNIYFDPEMRGRSEPIRQRIADWWVASGQAAFEAAQTDERA